MKYKKNKNNIKEHKLIKKYLESTNESNKALSKVYVTQRLINSRNDFSTDIYRMRSERKVLNNLFKKTSEIKYFIKVYNSDKLFKKPLNTIANKREINRIKKIITSFNLKNNTSLINQIEENILDINNVIDNLYNSNEFKKILSLSKLVLNNKKNLTIQQYKDLLNEKLVTLKNNNNTKIYKKYLKEFKNILRYSNLRSKYFIENYIDQNLSLINNLNKLIGIYNKRFFELKKEHNLNHPLDIIMSEFDLLKSKNINYTKIIYYSTKDLNTKIVDKPRCIIYSIDENNKVVINHLDIKNLENQKWVTLRELQSMVNKKKYIFILKLTSLILMATGPVLMILPGPQVISWIGFAMFLVYYADLIKKVVPFLTLWWQDQFLKYMFLFNIWKENRELKKAFKPVDYEKIKSELLQVDSSLTKDEINNEIKKIKDQNIANIKIYNMRKDLKSKNKTKKIDKKFFDDSFFKDDSFFYEPLNKDSIFQNNKNEESKSKQNVDTEFLNKQDDYKNSEKTKKS